QLDDEEHQARQDENVEQDVRPEPEEGVPVAGDPQARLERARFLLLHLCLPSSLCPLLCAPDRQTTAAPAAAGSRPVVVARARRKRSEALTQPKIPPWALIISRATRWNSGK